MSSQPQQRGGRGGGRGEHRGRGGGRGGHGGEGRGGAHAGGDREKTKKENILDLGKYMDKQITVKFTGGREGKSQILSQGVCTERENEEGMSANSLKIVTGTLKGYDALMNLVLDDVSEVLRGMHCL